MARKSSSKSRKKSALDERSIAEAHPGKKVFPSDAIRLVGKYGYRARYRIDIEGLDNMPDSGPVLVLAKHQRMADVPIGLSALVEARRERKMDIWCVMKQELVENFAANFYLGAGGIPLNRKDPVKSKEQLLFAREKLHAGKIVVIFPEQTVYPWKMGKGRPGGFRFIMGKPPEPVSVLCVGFEYEKKGKPRVGLKVRIGPPKVFNPQDDHEQFLHDRMLHMADLSSLEYKFDRPKGRKQSDADLD